MQNKNNTFHSTSRDNLAELTIPRAGRSGSRHHNTDDQIVYNGFSGINKNSTLNANNKFKLPETLSDKINTLMENKLNIQRSKNTFNSKTGKNANSNDASDEDNENAGATVASSHKRFNEGSKLKFNYVIAFITVQRCFPLFGETVRSCEYKKRRICEKMDKKFKL